MLDPLQWTCLTIAAGPANAFNPDSLMASVAEYALILRGGAQT